MPFAHITVVTEAEVPYKGSSVYAYDQQDQLKIYVGFTSTQDLIAWLNRDGCEVEVACIAGEWQVDDDGNTYDDFDAWELYPGDTWEGFKNEFRLHARGGVSVDNRAWREEIAREEGMLNGIDSYNDWMGY